VPMNLEVLKCHRVSESRQHFYTFFVGGGVYLDARLWSLFQRKWSLLRKGPQQKRKCT